MSESERMSFTKFKLDVDGDGIALVTWDAPGSTMNLIDTTMIAELSAIVEQIAADAEVKGAVITSGKDTFCAGADLTMLEGLSRTFKDLVASQGEAAANTRLFEESRKLSQLYRRIETCGKPFVAAINGAALGGGFELALACHRRIAADNARTRVGQPESQESGCFRAPAARNASRGYWRRPMRCNCCSRATSFGSIAPRR